MKREKSEKLLGLMGSVDEELLSEALEEKTPIRRRFRFSYAAIAACAALVLLTSVALGSQFFGKSPVDAVVAVTEEKTSAADTSLQTTVPASSLADSSQDEVIAVAGDALLPAEEGSGEAEKDNQAFTEGASLQTTVSVSGETVNHSENASVACATTTAPRTYQPYLIEGENGEANQPCQGTGSDDKPLETTRLVEGESGKTSVFTENPANGDIQYSDSLKKAIKEYGDNALYRVNLEVFSNGTKADPLCDDTLAETKRLERLGYITASETYFNGKTTACRWTLHATAQQLREFPVSENCGFRLSLYQEIAW